MYRVLWTVGEQSLDSYELRSILTIAVHHVFTLRCLCLVFGVGTDGEHLGWEEQETAVAVHCLSHGHRVDVLQPRRDSPGDRFFLHLRARGHRVSFFSLVFYLCLVCFALCFVCVFVSLFLPFFSQLSLIFFLFFLFFCSWLLFMVLF